MTIYQAPNAHIHNIVRLILAQGDNLVLCRTKGKEKFFLPGGHIENGELAEETLARELKEELGITEYQSVIFAGVCEGVFLRDHERGICQHEVNFVFEVHIPENIPIISHEEHIEFTRINKEELNTYALMPTPMRSGIAEWLATRKPFFKSFKD